MSTLSGRVRTASLADGGSGDGLLGHKKRRGDPDPDMGFHLNPITTLMPVWSNRKREKQAGNYGCAAWARGSDKNLLLSEASNLGCVEIRFFYFV